jgi:hypothetical protein
MQFFQIILPILLIHIPAVPTPQNCTRLDTLHWILGEWRIESDKNITIEKWVKLSPKTYEGVAQTFSKEDDKITFVEALRIVEMTDEVFYIAKVAHNAFPISFKLIDCSAVTAVFENTEHDFPKKIFYKLEDDGRLLNVTVSNEERQFTIEYKRLK